MKLTHDDLHKIIHDSEIGQLSYTEISIKMGIHMTTVSRFLNKEIHKKFWADYKAPVACGRKKCAHLNPVDDDSGKKLIILTSAQNNTYVHDELLSALEVLKNRYDGTIKVGTFLYDLKAQGDTDSYWFDPKIVQYIDNRPLILAEGLQWRGELNILPTAVNPIDGFKVYTGSDSFVLPHVKAHGVGLPVGQGEEPKFAYTTGSVTQRNYIQKTAGQKASFYHVFGALAIEIDRDGTWFAYRINAESETGNFYHKDTYYTKDGYTTGHSVEAINTPDAHIDNMSKKIAELIFQGGMIDDLRPKYMIYNDAYNGTSNNRHEKDNPLNEIKKMRQGKLSVQGEMKRTSDFVYKSQRDFCTNVITHANHDTITERWAKEQNWHYCNPINTEYLLECQLLLVKNADNESYYLFEDLMRRENPGLTAKFLRIDESFKVLDIEMGNHGHIGVNGSRGSIKSLEALGIKNNKGHFHIAYEYNGGFGAGVTNLIQGYNHGPTSWSITNVVTYPNGKRSLWTIRNNKYKVEYRLINGEWVLE